MGVPTPDESGKRVYGLRHNRRPEDPTRCVFEVYGRERWPTAYQCNKPRGHGPDGLFCKTHDPASVAKRGAEAQERRQAKHSAQFRPHRARDAYREVLQQIADGHNDPRGLAIEILKRSF